MANFNHYHEKGSTVINGIGTKQWNIFHDFSLSPIVLNLRGDTDYGEIPRAFRTFIFNSFLYTHTDDDGSIATDCDWCITEFISGNYEGQTFYIGHGETTVSRISYNKIKLENEDGQVAVYNLRTGELTIK